jgi:methylornithine synthase
MTLKDVLAKAYNEETLSIGDIKQILMASPEEEYQIFELARLLRDRYFDNTAYAYGFVYFTTYCKNKCYFCYYRQGNKAAPRYRKTKSDVVDLACKLAKSGVHLIDLTMGEDPYFKEHPEELEEIVREVHEKTKLPIMISPGVVDPVTLASLKDAGGVWYALYQETYDRNLFSQMRYEQDYDTRMELKLQAKNLGYLVEEGLMTGFGDTIEQQAEGIFHMGEVEPSQIRTMTFVPQKGTPLENMKKSNSNKELLMIAAMRLSYPDKLIPASLDVEGLGGLKKRLNAGANVITSLIPPEEGLAGVSQSELDIDNGSRSLNQIIPIIRECGLELGSHKKYQKYILKNQSTVMV